MNQQHTIRLSPWARIVLLSLLLGVGVLASLGLTTRPAHAQAASTVTITDCTYDSQLQSAVSGASSGDTIAFGCSGDIPLSNTLTISKNLTLDGSGRSVTLDGQNALLVLYVNSGVSFTLNALTIAHGFSGYGGGLVNDRGTVSISNSIVANNSSGNCSNQFGGSTSDQGSNLESGSDCGFSGTGDLQNTDPKLDPSGLQKNGGPTRTIALLSTSPAIDQVPAASCPATDQRGVSRLPGERCDMGAFEFPDTTAPTLSLPGTVTVDATSPQGASVTYTVTATDSDNPSSDLTISCSPASGSTFAIGTTTVKCSASDPSGNSSSGSFQVVVNGAATQVSSLITKVNNFHLSSSLQTALDNKLQDVLTAINAGQTATACSELTDFTGFVQSHTGKGITQIQANQLTGAAKQVQAVLGC